jgi:hypothetical protein
MAVLVPSLLPLFRLADSEDAAGLGVGVRDRSRCEWP